MTTGLLPRPPVLRRFGQTGLTVPEIGFTTASPGTDPALAEAALRLGMRFLCLSAPVPRDALAAADGDTLLATVDRFHDAGRWVPPASPGDRQWDLLIADAPLNALVDKDFLAAARAAMDAGRFGALAARVPDEVALRGVLDTGAFDAIELAFG